ncbi:MAG: hypothetical protein JRH15_03590 [Deltaproteobacteria bacterium]|nr:hypothetical protein [Deltaproteobacteria bacterium]
MNKKISYSLSDELMVILEQEFLIDQLVIRYKKTLEDSEEAQKGDIDKELFGTFGRKLADRLCELELGYRDRSAEILYKVAQKTGHNFPSIQQRLLEMAYLAIMNKNKLRFQEISFKRLAYEVNFCVLNKQLAEEISPEVAGRIPCRHLCMELNRKICENTDIGGVARVNMPSMISGEKGCCIFSTEMTLEEQLRLSGR